LGTRSTLSQARPASRKSTAAFLGLGSRDHLGPFPSRDPGSAVFVVSLGTLEKEGYNSVGFGEQSRHGNRRWARGSTGHTAEEDGSRCGHRSSRVQCFGGGLQESGVPVIEMSGHARWLVDWYVNMFTFKGQQLL